MCCFAWRWEGGDCGQSQGTRRREGAGCCWARTAWSPSGSGGRGDLTIQWFGSSQQVDDGECRWRARDCPGEKAGQKDCGGSQWVREKAEKGAWRKSAAVGEIARASPQSGGLHGGQAADTLARAHQTATWPRGRFWAADWWREGLKEEQAARGSWGAFSAVGRNYL